MTSFRIILISYVIHLKFLTNVKTTEDVALVLQLQEYFKSDLTLIMADDYDCNYLNTVKEFNKYNSIKMSRFIAGIDMNKNFERIVYRSIKSPFHDFIAVTYSGVNLIKKLKENVDRAPELMTSAIWIVLVNENISDDLEDLYVPFNCKFLIVNKTNASEYGIKDVYQISENHPKIYTKFGAWKNGELKIFERNFFGRRMDLQGHRFTITEAFFKEYAREYHFLWKVFSEKMNFSIKWDSRNKGDTSTGEKSYDLKDLISKREIDGTPSNFIVTVAALNFFDMIFPTMKSLTRFYVKPTAELNLASYVAPFKTEVWISILLWIVLASLIIQIVIRCKKHTTSEASLFIVMRALFNQAGPFKSSSISFCISYIIPYLLAIFLMQCYSGTLSSYLAFKLKIVPFQNLKEIIEDGTYKLTALEGTYNVFYFLNNSDPLPSAVREKKLLVDPEDLPKNFEAGFKQICDKRLVFISSSSNLLIKEQCEISELNEVLFNQITGIIVWKGFPYKNVMTQLMKRIQFAGLAKLNQKDKIYSNAEAEIFKPLAMELLYPIFVTYSCAIALALFLLLLEFMT